jgi:hypothetical protein
VYGDVLYEKLGWIFSCSKFLSLFVSTKKKKNKLGWKFCFYNFLQANKGVYGHDEIHLKLVQAFRLVVAGSTLWLLGAIHNAFQVYEKTGLRIQVLQKAVAVPCIVASELLLVSGVVALQISGNDPKLMVRCHLPTFLNHIALSQFQVTLIRLPSSPNNPNKT